MGKLLLIDCDVLVYASAFGAQKTRYNVDSVEHGIDALTFENAKDRDAFLKEKGLTKEDVTVTPWLDVLDESTALLIAHRNLQDIQAECKSENYQLFLTGKGNYREEVAITKPYKGNRDAPKPVHYDVVKQWYVDQGARIIDGQEADDAIGIAAVKTGGVVCTIDKDLNMIPGLHYDWNLGLKYKVSEYDAHRFFLQQLLTGDSTDNIPGLKGYGPKKAEAALADHSSIVDKWEAVKELYKSLGHDVEYLTEQGKLLWIRRKTGEIWTPDYYDTLLQELTHDSH